MKMSGLKPGARESGTLADHQPEEAAGFVRKLDYAERGRPARGSLFAASFVLSGSNKTQNSSQAAADTLAALG